MSGARKRASRPFREKAYRFLRWRKAHGGKVYDRRHDGDHLARQSVNRSGDLVELDVLFARSERRIERRGRPA